LGSKFPAESPDHDFTQGDKSDAQVFEELAGVFPGIEFVRRKKEREFEMGRITG